MFHEHYPALVVAYLVGLGGWLVADRLLPGVWPRAPAVRFERPWREFIIALVGAIGVSRWGSLEPRHPSARGRGLRSAVGRRRQLLIFAPILLVPVLRRQAWTTAWLPRARLATRLGVGVVLASLAVAAYALLREGADAPQVVIGRIGRYRNLDPAVQVLCEDLAIAIVFIRLAAALGGRWATVVVACLFAAGHGP